ncbi:MAG: hypothetical protein ACK412_09225 [Chloroherpetonaceae bacterium]
MSEQFNTESHSESPDNFNSILIGGAVIFVIGIVPFLNLINGCCLGMLLGGGVSVWHYTNQYNLTLTSGEGFKLGALAGLLGGLAGLVVSYVLIALFDYQPGKEELQELMLNIFGSDPAVRAQMEESFREQSTNALSASAIAISTITTAIIYPLFAGLGGIIGASLFKKGSPQV